MLLKDEPSPQSEVKFRRPASSRKSPGGSELLPFTDDGGHCAHWDLQSSRNFEICSSRQSCLGGLQTIPLTSCLVCALTCTVNCGTLYRQMCAFPNHVQSTEFTTGGLQLSCRNISRIISGNRMHLSSILNFMAKAVNTYVHVIS